MSLSRSVPRRVHRRVSAGETAAAETTVGRRAALRLVATLAAAVVGAPLRPPEGEAALLRGGACGDGGTWRAAPGVYGIDDGASSRQWRAPPSFSDISPFDLSNTSYGREVFFHGELQWPEMHALVPLMAMVEAPFNPSYITVVPGEIHVEFPSRKEYSFELRNYIRTVAELFAIIYRKTLQWRVGSESGVSAFSDAGNSSAVGDTASAGGGDAGADVASAGQAAVSAGFSASAFFPPATSALRVFGGPAGFAAAQAWAACAVRCAHQCPAFFAALYGVANRWSLQGDEAFCWTLPPHNRLENRAPGLHETGASGLMGGGTDACGRAAGAPMPPSLTAGLPPFSIPGLRVLHDFMEILAEDGGGGHGDGNGGDAGGTPATAAAADPAYPSYTGAIGGDKMASLTSPDFWYLLLPQTRAKFLQVHKTVAVLAPEGRNWTRFLLRAIQYFAKLDHTTALYRTGELDFYLRPTQGKHPRTQIVTKALTQLAYVLLAGAPAFADRYARHRKTGGGKAGGGGRAGGGGGAGAGRGVTAAGEGVTAAAVGSGGGGDTAAGGEVTVGGGGVTAAGGGVTAGFAFGGDRFCPWASVAFPLLQRHLPVASLAPRALRAMRLGWLVTLRQLLRARADAQRPLVALCAICTADVRLHFPECGKRTWRPPVLEFVLKIAAAKRRASAVRGAGLHVAQATRRAPPAPPAPAPALPQLQFQFSSTGSFTPLFPATLSPADAVWLSLNDLEPAAESLPVRRGRPPAGRPLPDGSSGGGGGGATHPPRTSQKHRAPSSAFNDAVPARRRKTAHEKGGGGGGGAVGGGDGVGSAAGVGSVDEVAVDEVAGADFGGRVGSVGRRRLLSATGSVRIGAVARGGSGGARGGVGAVGGFGPTGALDAVGRRSAVTEPELCTNSVVDSAVDSAVDFTITPVGSVNSVIKAVGRPVNKIAGAAPVDSPHITPVGSVNSVIKAVGRPVNKIAGGAPVDSPQKTVSLDQSKNTVRAATGCSVALSQSSAGGNAVGAFGCSHAFGGPTGIPFCAGDAFGRDGAAAGAQTSPELVLPFDGPKRT